MIYLELFWTFLTIGAFTFGGGYAMLPLIQEQVSARWGNVITNESMINFIAVSESTPGPFAINMATYVGSELGGVLGSLCATLGVVMPSFVIILLVMTLLRKLLKDPYAQAVLRGLKPCVVGIVLATGTYMILRNCAGTSDSRVNVTAIAMTALLAIIYFGSRQLWKGGLSPIGLIVLSALFGIAFYGWR